MKKVIPLLTVLMMVSFIGCKTTQNRPSYVWQNYSSSLYVLKKAPSDASLKNHKDVLLSIMEKSKNENCRVPPGVYCEYGYILLKEGRIDEALQYFDLEEKTYPESSVFIQNLKKYAIRTVKKDDDSKADINVGNESNRNSGDNKDINTENK